MAGSGAVPQARSLREPGRIARERPDGILAIFGSRGLTDGPSEGIVRRSSARRPAPAASGPSRT